jgi:hypothetical protein
VFSSRVPTLADIVGSAEGSAWRSRQSFGCIRAAKQQETQRRSRHENLVGFSSLDELPTRKPLQTRSLSVPQHWPSIVPTRQAVAILYETAISSDKTIESSSKHPFPPSSAKCRVYPARANALCFRGHSIDWLTEDHCHGSHETSSSVADAGKGSARLVLTRCVPRVWRLDR